MLKRIVSVLLSGILVLLFTSCKGASFGGEAPFYYETVNCIDMSATTEIAMVDGKLYCKWLEEQYDENGVRYDKERIDVIENIVKSREWKRVSKQSEVEKVMPYFDKVYTYPLRVEIGRFAVLTDEHNDYYILDTETGIQKDLELNLVDWRRFATDNKNYFAVLSAFSDGENKCEIRIYTLNQN